MAKVPSEFEKRLQVDKTTASLWKKTDANFKLHASKIIIILMGFPKVDGIGHMSTTQETPRIPHKEALPRITTLIGFMEQSQLA